MSSAPTYSRKGEEGDADECEGRRQQPPVPGLWILVPVANGGESDLQGGDQCPALGQTALKTETTQPKLLQQPSGTRRSQVTVCPELCELRCRSETWGRDGQLHGMQRHPDTHPASHQLGAFWCHLLSQRESCQLVQRLEAARNLPQEGLCLRQGKRTGSAPQTPSRQLRKAICMHRAPLLFIANLPSSAHQLVSTPLLNSSLLG